MSDTISFLPRRSGRQGGGAKVVKQWYRTFTVLYFYIPKTPIIEVFMLRSFQWRCALKQGVFLSQDWPERQDPTESHSDLQASST